MRSRLVPKAALLAAAGVSTLLLAPAAPGQVQIPPRHLEPYDYTSPMADGQGQEYVADTHVVTITDAVWLQLHFGHYDLGQNSYITITSMQDGSDLRLNDKFMGIYEGNSAFFNGESLLITLHVAPGDQDVFYSIAAATVGEWAGPPPESQCGPSDNRIPANDNRVGRLYLGGCTAWMTNYGALFTAGHCTDLDPDGGGPGLPDGNRDLSGVVELNVPLWPGVANANDQYPIITAGVPNGPVAGIMQWEFTGTAGLGADWGIFRCGPNANTGLTIHQAGGFFRVTDKNPAAVNTMRITGFGADSGSANFTNQTHTGPYVAEKSSGSRIWHEYQVDTEGGNSGSPIIWAGLSNSVAIGIHTNAGCDDPLTADGNNGTSMEYDPFQSAFDNFHPGSNEQYVDIGFALTWTESARNGHANRPWANVFNGVNAIASGGALVLVKGNYFNQTGTMGADGKAMFLYAPVGTVTIGD